MRKMGRSFLLMLAAFASAATLLNGCGSQTTGLTPAQSWREQSLQTQSVREGGGTKMAEKMKKLLVYVGTDTGKSSKGIYAFDLDLESGAPTSVTLAAETVNPSFLAIHPSHRFLYAVNEIGKFSGMKSGAVTAFAVDPQTGKLTFLNQQPTKGSYPCHIIVDNHGRYVFVANYGGGSVAVLPIQADGRLGEATAFIQHEGKSVNPQRQEAPHPHSINLDAANRFAIVADLGLDKLLVYRFDLTKGTLHANDPPFASVAPGAGPRHFAFHPNGRFAYIINELNSTVTAFRYDAQSGTLTELQTVSTLPEGFEGSNTTAEVQVHPSGKFLYGSNRGHDSIVIFAIDPDGRLRYVSHQPTQGKTPRNFGIDPTGTYLLAANQDSDNIVIFRIDKQTGKLQPTGYIVEVPTPICVKMMPK